MRDGLLKVGERSELGCKAAQVVTAGHDPKALAKGTKKGGQYALTRRRVDADGQRAKGPGPWGARMASRQGQPWQARSTTRAA